MAEKSIIILLFCCIELYLVQTLSLDYTDRNNKVFGEGVFVQSTDLHQEAWLRRYQKHSVFCDKDAVKIVLPSGALSELKVLGSPGSDPGLKEAKECSYSLTKKQMSNVLRVSFSSCHVTAQEGKYTLQLLYRNNLGPVEVATVSCDANSDLALQERRVRRSDGQIHWALAPVPDLTLHRMLPQNFTRAGCNIPTIQRLPCGSPEITDAECLNKGCCMDATNSSCYYPMDQCTADGHFVFTIYSHVTTMPVSPSSLHVASKNPCKPVVATNEFATFKFAMIECGTKFYNIGDTTIYMAEVRTAIRTRKMKYSIIARDHPVRLMVECRYAKITPTMIKATSGYMAVSPSVPASVSSAGLYGVQLRIANDKTFSSFSANSHQPLKVLLGRPLYLEVQINSPQPEATLLVNYCVAYTRSATNALVLLYESCPNPDLSTARFSFLRVLDLPQTPHQRRFVVTAFQFMNVTTQKYVSEEIYFMCSTEVCIPSETPCRKTCFDKKA